MNQKTEEVHGMVLSDIRYLDINKIGNVNRVKHFVTLLHNFINQCTSLTLVTMVAEVTVMKVNLITRKSVVILVTGVVVNVHRSSHKVSVILFNCNQT